MFAGGMLFVPGVEAYSCYTTDTTICISAVSDDIKVTKDGLAHHTWSNAVKDLKLPLIAYISFYENLAQVSVGDWDEDSS